MMMLAKLDVMPFTIVERVLAVEVATLLLMIEVVCVATPLIDPVKVLALDVRLLALIIAVVEARPFTVEVSRLPVDIREFVVALLIADCSDVVASTPLTLDVSTTPEVESAFEFTAVEVEVMPLTLVLMILPRELTVLFEITEEVAVTPLIVVVKVLPDRD